MSHTLDSLAASVLDASLIFLAFAMLLSFVRLWLGPTLSDRVVALDMLTVVAVGFMGVHAIRRDDPAYLDVAIVLAVIGFLSTVAFARYVERRKGGRA